MTPTINYAELVRKARTDYTTYLHLVWPVLSGNRAPLTPYELDAFTWATEKQQGRDPRRFLFAHREFGKSTGITYALPGFVWLGNPSATTAVFMKSQAKALEALTAVRGLLDQCGLLQHLKPPKDSWNKDHTYAFHVEGATNRAVPSFKALGSTGQVTAGRVNLAILDDFETLENSSTREARKATLSRMREIVRTAREDALLIALGTYHRDESAYSELIDDGWEHRIYPILYPTDEERDLATDRSTGKCHYAPIMLQWLDQGRDYLNRPTRPGGIVQPERFTPEYVARNHGGRVGEFRRHYMGIPRSAQIDEFQLRLSDLMVLPCTDDKAPLSVVWGLKAGDQSTILEDLNADIPKGIDDCLRQPAFTDPLYAQFAKPTVLALDPAGFGRDEMAWSIWSKLNGKYFCRALRGTRLRQDDQIDPDRRTLSDTIEGKSKSILSDIVQFNVHRVWVEQQFGGAILADRIKALLAARNIPCSVEAGSSTGQKEQRILAIARPLTSDHRVVIDRSVAKDHEFHRQYTRLTAQRGSLDHDDRIEAWAKGLDLVSDDDIAIPSAVQEANTVSREINDLEDLIHPNAPKPRWGDSIR